VQSVIAETSAAQGRVLGTRLDAMSYEQTFQKVLQMADDVGVHAVAAANTHLVAEALVNPEYAAVLESFDLVLPDGMPLVWALRLDGHEMRERVYGPYLMQHALRHSPTNVRHFFFGSSECCLMKLQDAARKLNPDISIAGVLSPPFGEWSEDAEAEMIDAINVAQADLVWVALGGVRQEIWIARNRHRLHRGVFLAVGDAFPLLAGLRGYAPVWMQRLGLTWLHRSLLEPRRMLPRYLKYNTRFAAAFLWERMRMTCRA
jgi:N-acetylglucosaminyldiphosphoundecaprenol N-acetyl-beta-D-mannosaminyltransferase